MALWYGACNWKVWELLLWALVNVWVIEFCRAVSFFLFLSFLFFFNRG